MEKTISKTDYVLWRDCPDNAWMKKWKPKIYYELPISEFDQNLIATGNQVEEKAREYFGNGILIHGREKGDLEETQKLIENGEEMLFQACFSDGTLFAAVDILKQGKNGELYIYEVKASSASKQNEDFSENNDKGDLTKGDTIVDFKDEKAVEKREKEILKDPHLYDLAFQVYLIRKLGYKVSGAFIVRLDGQYIRGESLNLQKLFVKDEVLKFVDKILPSVEKEIGEAVKKLTSDKAPIAPCLCIYKGRSKHCTTFKEINKDILKEFIDYSVHDIARIGSSKAKLKELIDRRIYDITKVPDDIEFSEKMAKQIRVHRREKPEINYVLIKKELEILEFPLYFLDYESFNPAIPRFAGFKPYQQIPFQFSLHILTKEAAEKGEEPKHKKFLYTDTEDPSLQFVKALEEYIGKSGRIIVWNKTFEESHVNKHLAIRLPEYADFIDSMNGRIFDLMTIFSKQLHIHPSFHGSASIKKVLNVLCPELDYKKLEITNGAETMNTWNRIVTGEIADKEKAEIEKAMLEYCYLDTYAMYAIWKYLVEITN